MSAEINDGGPAFPMSYHPEGNSADHQGMTLRDWFAGMALAGLLANPHVGGDVGAAARGAYMHADAMIAARKGGAE